MEAAERRGDAAEAFPVGSNICDRERRESRCALGLGKRRNPGSRATDSLFKRPLTLHTILLKETHVCGAEPRLSPPPPPPRHRGRWKTRQITAEPLANDNHHGHLQLLLAVHLILVPSKGPAELRQRDLFHTAAAAALAERWDMTRTFIPLWLLSRAG